MSTTSPCVRRCRKTMSSSRSSSPSRRLQRTCRDLRGPTGQKFAGWRKSQGEGDGESRGRGCRHRQGGVSASRTQRWEVQTNELVILSITELECRQGTGETYNHFSQDKAPRERWHHCKTCGVCSSHSHCLRPTNGFAYLVQTRTRWEKRYTILKTRREFRVCFRFPIGHREGVRRTVLVSGCSDHTDRCARSFTESSPAINVWLLHIQVCKLGAG